MLIIVKLCLILKFIIAYISVGCFGSFTCNNTDVFSETGLTSDQCFNTVAGLTSMYCYASICGSQMAYSNTSMTVEICLHICALNGFYYAGLQK
jgi:hypothetical protein